MAGATWNCSRLCASSVHTIQPCTMSLHAMPHTLGVCVFSCKLPPALLAEWPGPFTCYCGNTGVERMNAVIMPTWACFSDRNSFKSTELWAYCMNNTASPKQSSHHVGVGIVWFRKEKEETEEKEEEKKTRLNNQSSHHAPWACHSDRNSLKSTELWAYCMNKTAPRKQSSDRAGVGMSFRRKLA